MPSRAWWSAARTPTRWGRPATTGPSSTSSVASPSRTSATRTHRAGSTASSARTRAPFSASASRSRRRLRLGDAHEPPAPPAKQARPPGLLIDLREVLDALPRAPLGVVVGHGVDELLHELRREVQAGDDDARDLVVLDLVVDAGERDRELVLGVADVREVRVMAGHLLRVEVDVDVALRPVVLVSHACQYRNLMKIVVLAVGRIKPPYADDVQHYRKLLGGQAPVEVVEVRADEHVARRIPERAYVCLLDSGGQAMDSVAFSRWREQRRHEGRDVWFVIGGAFGGVELDR